MLQLLTLVKYKKLHEKISCMKYFLILEKFYDLIHVKNLEKKKETPLKALSFDQKG